MSVLETIQKAPDKEPLDLSEELKKLETDKKGAFDNIGGKSLPNIASANVLKELRPIESLKTERDRYLKERDDLGMPKGDPSIKRKRYQLKKKADKIQKKINTLQSTDNAVLEVSEIEKYENLAHLMHYPSHNLKNMSRYQFETEKLNILSKADKFFQKPAKTIALYLCKLSHITDEYPKIAGYSQDLLVSYNSIETQVKKCLIENGMNGLDMGSYIQNPYIGLGIAMSMPLIARYIYNRGLIKQGKNPLKNLEKGSEKVPPTKKKT